jgi:ATP-dependent exoDNAse (exonuclease V) beta subunit
MLVAPIGNREDDKHPTYAWVRRQLSLRADEELKRVLYVACTRARRSLHLLGTATLTKDGLRPDAKSLLGVGWPALQADFAEALRKREEAGAKVVMLPARREEEAGLALAAGAEVEPRPKLWLRRLRADAEPRSSLANVTFAETNAGGSEVPFERPHGSRDARQKGSVVHAMLEQLSRGVAPEGLDGRARSLLRGLAYSGKTLEDAVAEVLTAARNCASDADGAWILAHHARAQSETSWTGWKDGALETLRADRVFVAGAAPRAKGADHLWIIDYKMSAPAGDEDFLAKQRDIYAPQLARYARALREAEGIDLPVCFGLYYPRIARLDWWGESER